jgi:hypothetical protein
VLTSYRSVPSNEGGAQERIGGVRPSTFLFDTGD